MRVEIRQLLDVSGPREDRRAERKARASDRLIDVDTGRVELPRMRDGINTPVNAWLGPRGPAPCPILHALDEESP